MQTTTVASREQIDTVHRWRLEDLFEDVAAWEAGLGRVETLIAALGERAGTLGTNPETLAGVLAAHSEIGETLDRVYVYAHLFKDQDTRNAAAQAMAERAARMSTRVAEATAFLEPEILAIPEDRLRAFADSRALAGWRHYLGNLLRLKEHTLSPREEEILAMAGDVTRTPRTVFGMLNDADLTFRPVTDEEGREVELTKGRYSMFMESFDRRVREDAWTSLTEAYENHRNTMASLLAGSVKRDVFYARVRGYESSLAAALAPNNIPLPVFHTLVETVSARRASFHRYMEIRRRTLDLSQLSTFDLYVPLTRVKPDRIPYDAATATLVEGLSPLGGDYVRRLAEGFEAGWVDVYESRGKRSGAYSWGAYGSHPYVLMNYQGTLDHLFTLAHEMGHALHSHYTCEAQPYRYSHYPIFLAEVASTTNEAILMDHLLRTTDDPDRRLALLNQSIDQIRGTVVTQVMFAEFEHRVHELAESGDAITFETLSEIYGEIFRRMMGPALDFSQRASLGWARIPHFYTGYYVYQYATGYSAAIALSRRVLEGGARERDEYLGFLAAGDSDYPIEILRRAGVDLTTPGPVNDTLDLFDSLLDQLEEHLSKHGAPSGTPSTERSQ